MPGITYLQGLFKSGKLKIFRDLKYFLDEINSYQWKMDRQEQLLDKPRKENDHLMDSCRYAIFIASGDRPGSVWASPLGVTRTTARMFRRF